MSRCAVPKTFRVYCLVHRSLESHHVQREAQERRYSYDRVFLTEVWAQPRSYSTPSESNSRVTVLLGWDRPSFSAARNARYAGRFVMLVYTSHDTSYHWHITKHLHPLTSRRLLLYQRSQGLRITDDTAEPTYQNASYKRKSVSIINATHDKASSS